MKTLLFILLFAISFNTAASEDYNCATRQYNLDIFLTNDRSTSMFIIDRFNYNTVYVGYVGFIERKEKISKFHFYGRSGPIVLSFSNNDLNQMPDKMNGFIDAELGGFIVYENLKCRIR